MTTLDEFMEDFTPEERAKVAARTAELIEEEMTLLAKRRESGNFTAEGAESFRMRNSYSPGPPRFSAVDSYDGRVRAGGSGR